MLFWIRDTMGVSVVFRKTVIADTRSGKRR